MSYFLLVLVVLMFLFVQLQIRNIKKGRGLMLEWENLSERTKKLLKGDKGLPGRDGRNGEAGPRGQRGFAFRREDVQKMINETLEKNKKK